MSWKKNRFTSTVTFRLTVLFVVLFALLLISVLIPIDYTLRSIMLNRLDARITTHLGNFSYYAHLLDRKPRDQALAKITDNLRWTASIVSEDQVLWLMLSESREILSSSNTQPWQTCLQSIINSMPDLPHYNELPQPVRLETLQQPGLRFVDVEGVKQIAAFKTTRIVGKTGQYRAAFMKYHDGKTLIGIYSLQDIDQQMTRYRQILGVAFSVVLIVGAALGYLITRGAMAGVRHVTQTAQAIGQADLNQRVTLNRPGREIHELAHAFNEMLSRIQLLVKELKEVTTNIAHDLRSPITRMRGTAEAALQGPTDIETQRETHGKIIAECDRLVGIINTMLDIAAMNAGAAELPETSVDIQAVVLQAVDLFQPLAEDKAIRLNVNNPGIPITVCGSQANLQRVVSNILDNAIKFTTPGGTVNVDITATEDQVALSFSDTGIGISAEHQQYVFDRFYRVDTSRSTDGNGLGLSLAQSIIRAHHGWITVESEEGQGSRFTVVLPRS